MVSKVDSDALLGKLQHFGESGRGSRLESPERIREEHARQIGSLTEAVQAILRNQRQGPDWETVYRVPDTGHAGDFSYAVAGEDLFKLRHDLDFTPTRFIVVRHANARNRLVSVPDVGGLRITLSNARYVEFQFDQRAIDNRAVFGVCLFRDEFMPLGDAT